ncbi:bifunctional hydroxymethylpyrimidine kinase/phosphomethylpyrimidine kinase [Planctobacterium marinum]|uniref:Thiamine-phosphate synthase n=2 Tax=Planctobacterium marinum TaxID=1631968 RepID=A0AA48HZD0_9ALTE|nr:bifunctional hydroxymethylpyrimidine kinase/phosphomethylpyrimidine kinase [Planctobacterium marinum]
MTKDNSKSHIWAIGGSDCCAGAGIQADVKAAQKLEVYCSTVVTALTVQNSHGVQAINPVSTEVFSQQIDALQKDGLPDVIKVGLLATKEQVLCLTDWLFCLARESIKPLIVLDPVTVASDGSHLTLDDTREALKSHLLPLVDVVTANWQEALWLCECQGNNLDVAMVLKLLATLPVRHVLLKGGHQPQQDKCVDWLLTDGQPSALSLPHLADSRAHGTGCTLATALSAALAKGYPLKDAFVLAKSLVYQGLLQTHKIGCGVAKLGVKSLQYRREWFPEYLSISKLRCPSAPFASCDTQHLGLYPVVDSIAWLKRLLNLGVNTIQLRIKQRERQTLSSQIQQASMLAKAAGARLFINDYWQLAIEHGCYGVHLGQEDIEDADLNLIQASGVRLGVSTHGYFELLRALYLRPSYIAIGAIFSTTTKNMSGQLQGIAKLKCLVQLAQGYPLVAIGGINIDNIASVLSTGVGSVAVVSAITKAEHPEQVVCALQAQLRSQGVSDE